jgi:GNAT superfamily N-acetyltransferase
VIVRPYRSVDLAEMTLLSAHMHAESPEHVDFTFDPAKVMQIGDLCLDDAAPFICLVARMDEESPILGAIAGFVAPQFYGPDQYASDLIFYVYPPYRGSTAAARLLASFERWAKKLGAKRFQPGSFTGINPETTERFYRGMGFRAAGTIFVKDL